MLERIAKIKKVFGITNQDIADRAGMALSSVNQILQGYNGRPMSWEVVNAILTLCPTLSAEYLTRGIGPLTISPQLIDYRDIMSRLDHIENMLREK